MSMRRTFGSLLAVAVIAAACASRPASAGVNAPVPTYKNPPAELATMAPAQPNLPLDCSFYAEDKTGYQGTAPSSSHTIPDAADGLVAGAAYGAFRGHIGRWAGYGGLLGLVLGGIADISASAKYDRDYRDYRNAYIECLGGHRTPLIPTP